MWVINDLEAVGLQKDAVRQIVCVKPIEETKRFLRSLRGLHADHLKAWLRLKQRLGDAIPNSADFKKWGAGKGMVGTSQ